MRSIIVVGTDTGVGKTMVAAALARSLRSKGINVGVMKPFAASTEKFSNKFRSEDTAILAEAAKIEDQDNEINPFFYLLPTAPYVATCITGEAAIDIPTALISLEKIGAKHDLIIIEGIGGLMVPLTERETFADFAKVVKAPMIVVASCKLGTLNHILLTIHASMSYELKVLGVVLNAFPVRASAIDRQLINAITKLTDLEVLWVIPKLRRERRMQFEFDEEILDRLLERLELSEYHPQ